MKKAIATLMALAMVAALTACSGSTGEQSGTEAAQETAGEAEADAADTVETADEAEENTAEAEAEEETVADASGESDAEEESEASDGSSILVAYFSATNTTEGVAEEIAASLGADLYEIVPAEPYTDTDLNYNDDNSRTSIEMNDSTARPEIAGSVENMDQYEIIFLGYPIWWADAPRIMSTFVESYDFAGKTVVPFCTSGGSGVGSSASNLEALTEGATWLAGERLSGNASHEDIVEWINGLGLAVTAE